MTKESPRGILLWLMILLILACPVINLVPEATAKLNGNIFIGNGKTFEISVIFTPTNPDVPFTRPTFSKISAITNGLPLEFEFKASNLNNLKITSPTSITHFKFTKIVFTYETNKEIIALCTSECQIYPSSAFPTAIKFDTPPNPDPNIDYTFNVDAKITVNFNVAILKELLELLDFKNSFTLDERKDLLTFDGEGNFVVIQHAFKSDEDNLYAFKFNNQRIFLKPNKDYSFKVDQIELVLIKMISFPTPGTQTIKFKSSIHYKTAFCPIGKCTPELSMSITQDIAPSLTDLGQYFFTLDSTIPKPSVLTLELFIDNVKINELGVILNCDTFANCFDIAGFTLPECNVNNPRSTYTLKLKPSVRTFDITKIEVVLKDSSSNILETIKINSLGEFTIDKELKGEVTFEFQEIDNDEVLYTST